MMQPTHMLPYVREGDTVVMHSMDRLARNLDDLRRLVQGLTQRGVRVEFLKESLVFIGEDSPMANLMLSVMGALRSSSGRLKVNEKGPAVGARSNPQVMRRSSAPRRPGAQASMRY